jgi:ATP-dependent RNA helicase DeaD
VIDLLERRVLNLQSVRVVVLDEADRMLDMGFVEDIEYILSRTPSDRQTSLFSATIDKTVMSVCNRYMKNPEKVLVSKDEIALTQMNQYYMLVNPRFKFEAVCRIIRENKIDRAIVFCRTRTETAIIAEELRKRGYDARALHAGYTQAQRDAVMSSFRRGKLKLLVATDLAARGLDIQEITHIINYDVPLDALVYFHRIGRTARKGNGGTAITLVDYAELPDFNNIKALTKTTIEELPSLANDSAIQEFR